MMLLLSSKDHDSSNSVWLKRDVFCGAEKTVKIVIQFGLRGISCRAVKIILILIYFILRGAFCVVNT